VLSREGRVVGFAGAHTLTPSPLFSPPFPAASQAAAAAAAAAAVRQRLPRSWNS